MASQQSVITEEMKKLIGVESKPVIYEVEAGAIRRFAEAIADPNPLYYDEEYAKKSRYGKMIAPPTFFGWPTKEAPRTEIIGPFKSVLNGGNEVEYTRPVYAGDRLVATTKVVSLQDRDGRLGKMLITVRETTYKDAKNGELVAKARGTLITYGAPSSK